jgi:hypothetical protein
MKNKQGQIFEFILFIITVFMCSTVITLYFIQQENAGNSLVSPKPILDLRDGMEIFQLQEKEMIMQALIETKNTYEFNSQNFAIEFKSIFLKKLNADAKAKNFIFSNLTREDEVRKNSDSFLESIYLIEKIDNQIAFARTPIEKNFLLKAEKRNKINFPVKFSHKFEKKYLITYEDKNFKLEEK